MAAGTSGVKTVTDKMREDFEAWVEKEAKARRYTYMDFLLIRDPVSDDYRTTWVDMAWMGWQASRESLVFELPKGWGDDCINTKTGKPYEHSLLNSGEIRKLLEAAGLKVKP